LDVRIYLNYHDVSTSIKNFSFTSCQFWSFSKYFPRPENAFKICWVPTGSRNLQFSYFSNFSQNIKVWRYFPSQSAVSRILLHIYLLFIKIGFIQIFIQFFTALFFNWETRTLTVHCLGNSGNNFLVTYDQFKNVAFTSVCHFYSAEDHCAARSHCPHCWRHTSCRCLSLLD